VDIVAIKKCPECSNQVSDKAYECPNCGFVMKDRADSFCGGSCLLLVVIVIIIILCL